MEFKNISAARHLKLYLAQIYHFTCQETEAEEREVPFCRLDLKIFANI